METASFSLSVEDYVDYNRRFHGRRLARILAVTIALVAVLTIAIDGSGGIRSILFGAGAGLAAFLVYLFLIIPWSARAIYAEQASMAEERTLLIDQQGAEFRQQSGVFWIEWRNVVQWDETARLLTLFVNRAMFVPITKSEIGEAMTARIKQFLIDSGLPAPLRRRASK